METEEEKWNNISLQNYLFIQIKQAYFQQSSIGADVNAKNRDLRLSLYQRCCQLAFQ